jgi:hypothetical protein
VILTELETPCDEIYATRDVIDADAAGRLYLKNLPNFRILEKEVVVGCTSAFFRTLPE